MAKLQYNPETHKVEDKSPGRSIYLSNAQWAALNEYLKDKTNDEVGTDEILYGALNKLYKISKEVCNK